jgi:hypothetical protein
MKKFIVAIAPTATERPENLIIEAKTKAAAYRKAFDIYGSRTLKTVVLIKK